jgi:hypothetical protein
MILKRVPALLLSFLVGKRSGREGDLPHLRKDHSRARQRLVCPPEVEGAGMPMAMDFSRADAVLMASKDAQPQLTS